MAAIRARVLVVDDDRALRTAIRRMLGATYEVVEAPDGQAAVDMVLAGERFDLVLMDLMMPRLNGRDALARLEAIDPELAAHTIIMSGGSTDGELRAWFQALGEGRSLLKPFSTNALHDAVASALAR